MKHKGGRRETTVHTFSVAYVAFSSQELGGSMISGSVPSFPQLLDANFPPVRALEVVPRVLIEME